MSRSKKNAEPEVSITDDQKLEAATNDPALSNDSFELGGKTYKVVHLKYKSYVAFLRLLEPVMKGVLGVMSHQAGLGLAGIDLGKVDTSSLVGLATENLPSLVQIVCSQTEPITVQEIEEMETTPFDLANIVFMQVKKIQLGDKFSAFITRISETMK